MKKRVLSLFLALGLCLGLLPTAALAAESTITEAVPCKYSGTSNFSEGLAAVRLDRKWGFIDKTGKEVIPCKYNGASGFSEGLAAVAAETYPYKWGFIDKTGQKVIPCKYDDASDFSDGLAAVELDGKWGFIDTTGKEVLPCTLTYHSVKPFSDGLAAVKTEDDKWGFIDKTGKEVVPCKYMGSQTDGSPIFSEGLAAMLLITDRERRPGSIVIDINGDYVVIDNTGKEVVPLGKYKCVNDFSEGLAAAADENGWGFIDKTGQEVISCKYSSVSGFSEGLAAVAVGEYPNRKWGFIDKTGKEVVPCTLTYSTVRPFSDGLAKAGLDSGENGGTIYKWGFIDKTGKEVVPLGKYNNVNDFSEGLAAVRDENGLGFISANGAAAGETPAPASTTAYASTQTVMVDNKPVEFNAYALKDANGNMTNYVKLRDVASVLNGSAAQFQVGWDGSISITTKQAYTANGSEMVQNFSGDQQYTVNTSPVKVNGQTADMEAITLTDATGGYTYFKLRDLGKALGFNVSWTDGKIVIDPNSPYSDAN